MNSFVLFCSLLLLGSLVESKDCRERTPLINKEGVISDGSRDGNYTAGPRVCSWVVDPSDTTDEEYVTLVFDYVYLFKNETVHDSIEIYDGVDELFGKLLFVLTGNQVPPPIVTTGRTLFVKFIVRGTGNYTDKGFMSQYSAGSCPEDCSNHGFCFLSNCNCEGGYSGVDCSKPICENECGGNVRGTCGKKGCECTPGYYGGDCTNPYCRGETLFETETGSFTDHHVNELGLELYEKNNFCRWLIRPPPGAKDTTNFITLHFDIFSTTYQEDWVHVYSSETPDLDHLLGALSGTVIPKDMVSHTGVMLVTFETDVGAAAEGFTASFSTQNKKTMIIEPAQKESGWLAFGFAVITFILGIGFGYVFYPFVENVSEGTEEDGGYTLTANTDVDLDNLLNDTD